MDKRAPAVAGRFYPADGGALAGEVRKYLAAGGPATPRTACVAPHAGYSFSGPTAGRTLARVTVPATVIILSPNHTGAGAGIAVWTAGAWRTPLGDVAIDAAAAVSVAKLTGAQADTAAHRNEHSIEVMLPFLKTIRPDVRIVPVTIMTHDLAALVRFGRELAGFVRGAAERPLVLASSDMTHMESAESAHAKDMQCVARMEAVDPEGLFNLVNEQRISMCGVAPVTAMLAMARELGLKRGELVEYTSSGDTSGDYHRVVGYAGLVF
ncbi:MAG: AmmeMemoRadiSam system protein B [Planctomycetota bacterium]